MAALRPILSGTPWDGAADRADAASDLLSMLRQHFMTVRDFAGTCPQSDDITGLALRLLPGV